MVRYRDPLRRAFHPMFRASPGRSACIFCLLVLVLLASCAPTFLYRHADRLVTWKVDDYFDLRSEQKQFVRSRVQSILASHRREALPVYEAFLAEVKHRSADGITRQEVDWAFARYEQLKQDLFQRVSGDAVLFLTSINEGQVRYLEHVFRKEQDKWQHLLGVPVSERLDRRASDTVRWLTDWLGTLTKDQRDRVVELSRRLPDVQRIRLEYRSARQRQFVETLWKTREPAALIHGLANLMLAPMNEAPPTYRAAMERFEHAVRDMIVEVDQMITPQQRSHALGKLQELIDDIHQLRVS